MSDGTSDGREKKHRNKQKIKQNKTQHKAACIEKACESRYTDTLARGVAVNRITYHLRGWAVAHLVHLQFLLGGERHAACLTHVSDRRGQLRRPGQTRLLAGQALLQRPYCKHKERCSQVTGRRGPITADSRGQFTADSRGQFTPEN